MPQESPVSRSLRALVMVCFFCSGATALVYEIVWMRRLALVFGATTLAVSTVLSTYMMGLALGAILLGRMADRSLRPLQVYAYLEFAIGLYALAVPHLIDVTMPLYVMVAQQSGESLAVLTLVRFALTFLILLVPTLLMGGTLPVLVRFVGRVETRWGIELGALYGINLAGAVTGCFLAGFWLIRLFGVRGAGELAAGVNLAIGLAALFASRLAGPLPDRAEGDEPPAVGETPPVSAVAGRQEKILRVVIFLSGFITMGYEVLWTRVLVFTLKSTVFAFSVILATFLAGLALGSWFFALFIEGRRGRWESLAGAHFLGGVLGLLSTLLSIQAEPLTRAISSSLGFSPAIHIATMVSASALVILLPATCMGIVFPLATRLLIGEVSQAGRELGRAYWVNSLGAVTGSLATGFLLIPLGGLEGGLVFFGVLQFVIGAIVLRQSGLAISLRRGMLASAAVFLVAELVLMRTYLVGPNPFDPLETFPGGPHATYEAHHDGITASVSVLRDEQGSRSIRIDGFYAAADGAGLYGYMPMMTHIPMLLHPDPRRLLVICFGTGTTAGTGLLYPGAQIDVVDINQTVFDFADHFRDVNRDIRHDPRARLILNDGRNHLLVSPERYDVITSEPMPPTYAGVVSLYSREYYLLARERLNPGGLIAQWLPFHLLTVEESWQILRTVVSVFPETSVWLHGTTGIIVARREAPISLDLELIRQRMNVEPLRAALRQLEIADAMDFAALFATGPAGIEPLVRDVTEITDDRPSLEFDSLRSGGLSVIGSRVVAQAVALETLISAKRVQPLPPRPGGAPADPEAQEYRRVVAFDELGELYRSADLLPEAREVLEQGLRGTAPPALRERLLRRLESLGAPPAGVSGQP